MKRSALIMVLVVWFGGAVFGQTVTQQSYAKARPILDKAIAAFGGIDALRSISNVTFRIEGDSVHRNQSRRTFFSERTPYKAEITIDVKNTRYRQSQQGQYPGGFHWHNGFGINKAEGATWDYMRRSINPIPNIPAAGFRQRLRTIPHFVILNAAERSSRLRYLGPATHDKRAHEVISYANEDGLEISLFIDVKTGLLSKLETLGTDPFSGDVVNEIVFTGYRLENGRNVPTGRLDQRSGETMNDYRFLDIVFNAELTDDHFKAPQGMTIAAAPPANTPPVTKHAENIYTVSAGGYNVLFVGFKDHVFVMEAPGGDNVSKQAIEQIKKTIPGKPIRYIAVTHHHDDHAGGIRTYIAEGAELIALPGEKAFFEQVAKSVFTIDPDSLTLNPQPLKSEVIDGGKRVLTDGTMTVELRDIGSGPHTDQMLVAYFPNEKMVFQGDLLNRPANGDPPIANDTTVHFANWIVSSKLPVEKVLGVHGPASTFEELRSAVERKQKETK
jgi:glyoxylase-like metal-dependent hydrolase (beta-lactamase superfamily II)